MNSRDVLPFLEADHENYGGNAATPPEVNDKTKNVDHPKAKNGSGVLN